jgi:hypothetical protein
LLSVKRDSEPRLIWDGDRFVPEEAVRVTVFQGFEHRLTCSALAGPGSSAPNSAIRYDLEPSGAAPALFRFPMVDGSAGVGIIRVVVGNVVTRGLSVE